jgi:hypothetical protein
VDLAQKIRLVARAIAACGVALSMPGCASPDIAPSRSSLVMGSPEAFVGNQGSAWEVLFPPGADPYAGQEAESRRDAALSRRQQESVIEAGMWPEAPVPHLGQSRRLFLPRRADEVLYLR